MKKFTTSSLVYIALILYALYSLIPIFIIWISALKTTPEILQDPFALPTVIHWDTLVRAWTIGRFGRYMSNTIIITLPTVSIVLSLSVMAGYAFGKLKFAGSKLFFYIFLLGIMVPFQAIMIPVYYLARDMRLLGTYWAMILPASALGLSFGIFFMQAFFRSLPSELMDAGRIDGCSEFRVFSNVMLPLARPAISTLLVFQFMWTWNSFLMPLILLNKENLRPQALGIMFFMGEYVTEYNLIAAGVTIATLPVMVIFIIFQRQFVKGITAGAIKG